MKYYSKHLISVLLIAAVLLVCLALFSVNRVHAVSTVAFGKTYTVTLDDQGGASVAEYRINTVAGRTYKITAKYISGNGVVETELETNNGGTYGWGFFGSNGIPQGLGEKHPNLSGTADFLGRFGTYDLIFFELEDPEGWPEDFDEDNRNASSYSITFQFCIEDVTPVKASAKVTKVTIGIVKAGKKKIQVKWKKVKNASFYQIQYATNKKFTKGVKTIKVKKYLKKGKTIKKLKAKKKYFVRVRACRKVNGKVIRGKWSKIKKVKTK